VKLLIAKAGKYVLCEIYCSIAYTLYTVMSNIDVYVGFEKKIEIQFFD